MKHTTKKEGWEIKIIKLLREAHSHGTLWEEEQVIAFIKSTLSQALREREDEILSDYWSKNFVGNTGLCMLCRNTGIVTGHAFYCFCPNGRGLNKQS